MKQEEGRRNKEETEDTVEPEQQDDQRRQKGQDVHERRKWGEGYEKGEGKDDDKWEKKEEINRGTDILIIDKRSSCLRFYTFHDVTSQLFIMTKNKKKVYGNTTY